jgi:hypothetical protein
LNNSPVPSFLRFYLIVAGKVLHPFITSTWMFHESVHHCAGRSVSQASLHN